MRDMVVCALLGVLIWLSLSPARSPFSCLLPGVRLATPTLCELAFHNPAPALRRASARLYFLLFLLFSC